MRPATSRETPPAPGRLARAGLVAAYLACVPLANWLMGHVGTTCPPGGPCLVPVAPGLLAPSGVMAVGLALVLRDLVQGASGVAWSLGAAALGTALSLALAPPALVLASGLAFATSELADLAVYTPLRRRGLALAVLASGAVGAAVDSALFLALAFGSLDHLGGQVVGKLEAVTLAALAIAWWRGAARVRAADVGGGVAAGGRVA